MNPSLIRLAIKLALCSAFVPLPTLRLWFQIHSVGKLVVQSTPHQGAAIFVNNTATNQETNTTFVLSPGTYWVAVTGGPDNLKCGGDSGEAVITPGSVVTLTCTKSGVFQRQ
jgi:hypothetical protein